MPTPDTETLAARLRAVERALTDDDAVLDPPNDGAATEASDPDTAATPGAPGPDPDVKDRLCRLEAAVQALHAALGEGDTDAPLGPNPPGTGTTESSGTDTHSSDKRPGGATEAVPDPPRELRELGHSSRPSATTGWPDDLAAE